MIEINCHQNGSNMSAPAIRAALERWRDLAQTDLLCPTNPAETDWGAVVDAIAATRAALAQPVGEGPPAVTTSALLHPAYEPGDGSADGAQMVGMAPEHSARPLGSPGFPEVEAAYRYVDSVVQHADAISPCGGHAWHGWALREAFLAGCTHYRENGGYIVPTVAEVAWKEVPAAPPAPAPVAPVSDSKMSAYNHRAAARFAILDRLGKAIDFNSHGWRLTSEGERWTRLMAEQEQDECEMGL